MMKGDEGSLAKLNTSEWLARSVNYILRKDYLVRGRQSISKYGAPAEYQQLDIRFSTIITSSKLLPRKVRIDSGASKN